jgi:hypothetical protein
MDGHKRMEVKLDEETFQYVRPPDRQIADMAVLRGEFTGLCKMIEDVVPDGEDKDYAIRLLRSAGMWCNIAITRHEDGRPREA